MNLKKLKKEFGDQVAVSRDRKRGIVTASARGLSYRAEESRFGTEHALAEHLKSKLPVLSVAPGNGQ
jgi:hypothetical protein